MKKNKPWLYIPIETKVRELHGKILLACFAAIKGFNVVIGSKHDINLRSAFFPKGVVFNIGLAKNMAKNSKKYKEYGHSVATMDEEGLVTLNDDLYIRHRVSKEALDLTDMLFTWGKKQAELIGGVNKGRCKIFITGNPRFDMLRPEYKIVFNKEVEEIRKEYGKFILVNTNFGHGNHFAGKDFLLKSFEEKGWMEDSCDRSFFLQNIEWHTEMFKKFIEMISELSKNFKNHNIIIRPHPSENHEIWKKIAKNYSNVFVVHSGNVIPWLMATDVLIHNGCTTAVEAFLLGTKIVAYRPFIINEQETELPNKISVEAYDMLGLIDTLNKILNNISSDDKESKKVYLESYLAGINGKAASENIASNLLANTEVAPDGLNYFAVFYFETLAYVKKIIIKILFNKNIPELYQLHKLSGLSENEISDIIKDFSKIDKRLVNLHVKRIGLTCYQIYERK